jgi:RNA polymerase sigma-70 factor (ECF subfamily)
LSSSAPPGTAPNAVSTSLPSASEVSVGVTVLLGHGNGVAAQAGDRERIGFVASPPAEGGLHQDQQAYRRLALPAAMEVLPGGVGLTRSDLVIDEALDRVTETAMFQEGRHRSRNPLAPVLLPDRRADCREGRGLPTGSPGVRDPARTGPPAGAEAAFQDHVVPEIDVLYRVALSITRSHADAEDLVQDTLLRAYRAIDRFDGRHPRAWLLTILRNAHINRARRRRPDLLHDPEEVGRRAAIDEDTSSRPEEAAMAGVLDEHLGAALDALPFKFRQAVDLIDVTDLSYQEAAAVLGVPVGTVMSRLSRGRKRLRDHLAREGVLPRRIA